MTDTINEEMFDENDNEVPIYECKDAYINEALTTIYNDVEEVNDEKLADIYNYIIKLEANQKKKRVAKVKTIERKEYEFRDGKMLLSKKAVAYLKKKGTIEEDFEDFKLSKIQKKLVGFNEKAKSVRGGGNAKKDEELETPQSCLYWDLEAKDISGNSYWTTNGSYGGGGSRVYYKPSYEEIVKFRDTKECKNSAVSWNSATAHSGSNANKCCSRLKAFKEIKVCMYVGVKDRPLKNVFKKTYKTDKGDFEVKNIKDLKKLYGFKKKDFVDVESK